jgi:hypothetical protein
MQHDAGIPQAVPLAALSELTPNPSIQPRDHYLMYACTTIRAAGIIHTTKNK